MKRILAVALWLTMLLTLTACGQAEAPEAPNTQVPSVMYNGILYRTTGKQLAGEVDESAIVGHIHSVVHGSQLPTEDGQANFPSEGAPYAMTIDGLVVLLENEWTLFKPASEIK